MKKLSTSAAAREGNDDYPGAGASESSGSPKRQEDGGIFRFTDTEAIPGGVALVEVRHPVPTGVDST